MQLISGTIRSFDEETRIFEIVLHKRIQFFYLSRSQTKKFKPYLNEGLVVHFTCKDERVKINGVMAYEVIHFIKMLRHLPRKTIFYYDLSIIRKGVKKIFNRDGFRLFLDLEFTMPPHGYTHGGGFVAEIIQYGLYLEDQDGNLITTENGMIRPSYSLGVNSRTLEFLKMDEQELIHAPKPYVFYNQLKNLLTMYQPTIYVWGKNDIIMLDSFYEQHKFKKLVERKSFVNLMQVIKNYYGIKTDIGLFHAYEFFNSKPPYEQDHNALNDAVATSEIFKLFQKELNTEVDE